MQGISLSLGIKTLNQTYLPILEIFFLHTDSFTFSSVVPLSVFLCSSQREHKKHEWQNLHFLDTHTNTQIKHIRLSQNEVSMKKNYFLV